VITGTGSSISIAWSLSPDINYFLSSSAAIASLMAALVAL